MSWFTSTFTSSIGKKLVMSLAGLFLIIFLLVHLGINLMVLLENNMYFNKTAHFMGTNILIKIFEIVLFGGFIIHMIYALFLQIQNWLARPVRYKIENLTNQTSFFSKYMIHTSVVILVFLVIHLVDFYIKAKFIGDVSDVVYNGKEYHDLAALVEAKFLLGGAVIFYLIALLFLGFHLNHGFQSAFQTLGIDHKKYTPVIKFLGVIYSILVPLGYACIPLIIYFAK
ncbi:MAG: succinate dehydrogenase cytochrome b subunit [Bacteroidetes bacterium]|nr:succinate dehydrogenase cytochrome b subunit [Bacteroidota bacterium]MBL6962739.1 succinate dehydrogenase cytochrome b subunit [Bacteroidota bacterium]